MDSMNRKIEINQIRKRFHRKEVLREASFQAEPGMCVGILGGNGSGKSTFLSILAGVQKPDGGEFLWQGTDLFQNPRLLARATGYVPQGTPLLEELTAWDNLLLWYDRAALQRELYEGVLAMLGIPEFIKTRVSKMSGGMKKRLSIGCAVAQDRKSVV